MFCFLRTWLSLSLVLCECAAPFYVCGICTMRVSLYFCFVLFAHPLFLSPTPWNLFALGARFRCRVDASRVMLCCRARILHTRQLGKFILSAKVGPVNLAIQHVLCRHRARIRECFLSFAMCVYQKSFFLTHVSLAAANM
jgi:hypothetical protein